jgi:hypothetical protein
MFPNHPISKNKRRMMRMRRKSRRRRRTTTTAIATSVSRSHHNEKWAAKSSTHLPSVFFSRPKKGQSV